MHSNVYPAKGPATPRAAALVYAGQLGWTVFPSPWTGDNLKKSLKSAQYSGGRRWGATTDLAEIERDWKKWPLANVCVVTGSISGVFVVEADTMKGHGVDGIANLKALEQTHSALPKTLTALSPSGSTHYYFKWPPGITIRCSNGKIAKGVDIKADFGMVVAPPSKRPDGQYNWLNWGTPIADAPQWLIDLALTAAASSNAKNKNVAIEDLPEHLLDLPQNIAHAVQVLKTHFEACQGDHGDQQTFEIARYLKTLGLRLDTAVALALEHYNPRCKPMWEPDKLREKFANGYNYSHIYAAGSASPWITMDGMLDTDSDDEGPRPLTRALPPGLPFPVKALPNSMQGAIGDIVMVSMVPDTLAAQSTVASSCFVVQPHADVALPISEHHAKPLSEFFVCIAESSERKTTADDMATIGVHRHQRSLLHAYQVQMILHGDQKRAHDLARKAAEKANKNDPAALLEALAKIGPAPALPLEPLLLAEEPNYQGLVRQFEFGQPSLGLFSNEGGAFLGGWGMQKDNITRTATGLSELWDGKPITKVRASGSVFLHGRRLAAHLMVQPVMAGLLLNNDMLRGQGLMSRCLLSWPESNIGNRIQKDGPPPPTPRLDAFSEQMLAILQQQPQMMHGGLNPRRLPLVDAARSAWRSFANKIEVEMKQGGPLEHSRAFAGKLAEHAARLAGVFTLVDDIEAGWISAEQMERGIELAEFYLSEILRIEAAGKGVSREVWMAQELLEWAQKQPDGLVALVDAYQRGPYRIREMTVARRAVGVLENHGWLKRVEGSAVVNGKKRKEVWQVIETAAA
jgi:hypothetical protein